MSNETAAQLQTVNVSIDEARKSVDKRDALARLVKNRDFKTIISTGFFEKEAIRTVALKSHPAFQGDQEQLDLDRIMFAIGSLQQYLLTIRAQGDQMERGIAEMEQTRDELMVEDLEAGNV